MFRLIRCSVLGILVTMPAYGLVIDSFRDGDLAVKDAYTFDAWQHQLDEAETIGGERTIAASFSNESGELMIASQTDQLTMASTGRGNPSLVLQYGGLHVWWDVDLTSDGADRFEIDAAFVGIAHQFLLKVTSGNLDPVSQVVDVQAEIENLPSGGGVIEIPFAAYDMIDFTNVTHIELDGTMATSSQTGGPDLILRHIITIPEPASLILCVILAVALRRR